MKRIITIIALMFAAWNSKAQWILGTTQAEQAITCSHALDVSDKKTTSLIFPAVIKSVDKGSAGIFAQRARDVDNVLLVKAARENFEETNLTVITADGVLHEFTVNYASAPENLTFDMSTVDGFSQGSRIVFAGPMAEAELEKYCLQIVASRPSIHFSRKKKHRISLALRGIYIRENVIFYRITISNSSNINYDIDFLKFFIRDDARIKRTASQETEAEVIYSYGDVQTVKGKSGVEVVYALEKFTIPDSKHLALEMFERNGGRHYRIKIKNRQIVNASLLR